MTRIGEASAAGRACSASGLELLTHWQAQAQLIRRVAARAGLGPAQATGLDLSAPGRSELALMIGGQWLRAEGEELWRPGDFRPVRGPDDLTREPGRHGQVAVSPAPLLGTLLREEARWRAAGQLKLSALTVAAALLLAWSAPWAASWGALSPAALAGSSLLSALGLMVITATQDDPGAALRRSGQLRALGRPLLIQTLLALPLGALSALAVSDGQFDELSLFSAAVQGALVAALLAWLLLGARLLHGAALPVWLATRLSRGGALGRELERELGLQRRGEPCAD